MPRLIAQLGPQQQQIAQAIEAGFRHRINAGKAGTLVAIDMGDPGHRIALRKAAAEAGGDQQITHPHIGGMGQILQGQAIQLATADGNGAHIVAVDTHRNGVHVIGDQQYPAGGGANGHHLANNAALVEHRLTFIDTIKAALVDHQLQPEGVAGDRKYLGHRFAHIRPLH